MEKDLGLCDLHYHPCKGFTDASARGIGCTLAGADQGATTPISERSGPFEILHTLFLTVVVIVFLATSCATHRNLQTTGPLEAETSSQNERSSDSREIEKLIYEEYIRWKGTPHRLGGTGQGGLDCSAFVKEVYKNAFNIELPRTTTEQVKSGRRIKREDLRAGDLVFFRPPRYPRHVGILLKRRDFVHATKSEGVTISQIAPDYWGKYYWTARRILHKPLQP